MDETIKAAGGQPAQITQPPEGALKDESKVFGALAYVFGLLIAVIIFLFKKDDAYVKFHAAQAILLGLCVMVVSIVLMVVFMVLIVVAGIASMGVGFFLGFWVMWLVFMVYGLVLFVFNLYLAYNAYKGKRFLLPILGKQAEKMVVG